MKTIFALFSLSIAACGTTGPLEPGAGDSLGSGTQTLVVNGTASARPRLTNAHQASDFDTDFSVRVSLNNAAVTTGTVTITSLGKTLNLTFNPNSGGQFGRWEGTANGYDEVYQFDVVSGTDNVQAVRVDGPDIQTFTAPTAGASVDSTMANTVTWSRAAPADIAEIQAGDNGNPLTIDDTGTYSVAPGTLKADRTQSKQNTIRLIRTNRVTPTGAAAGSQVAVSVTNEIDVVALPNPAL
ncbi:MAG: hypothetical protein JWO36_2345 [Myxococcales bacterium]|nr:hypothetical protein [Myxococcales bacterium]